MRQSILSKITGVITCLIGLLLIVLPIILLIDAVMNEDEFWFDFIFIIFFLLGFAVFYYIAATFQGLLPNHHHIKTQPNYRTLTKVIGGIGIVLGAIGTVTSFAIIYEYSNSAYSQNGVIVSSAVLMLLGLSSIIYVATTFRKIDQPYEEHREYDDILDDIDLKKDD